MLPNTGGVSEQQLRVTSAFKKMVCRVTWLAVNIPHNFQIDLVTSRLDPIPHLSIYYRATAPGHPACSSSTFYKSFRVNSTITAQPDDSNRETGLFTEKSTFYTDPYPNASIAQLAMSTIGQSLEASTLDSQQKVVRSRWDWDRFDAHNAEWKHIIEDIVARQKTLTNANASERAKWYYMDIWDMALQRPDAHTQNLVDPAHENYDCLHCASTFVCLCAIINAQLGLRVCSERCGTMDEVSQSPRVLG